MQLAQFDQDPVQQESYRVTPRYSDLTQADRSGSAVPRPTHIFQPASHACWRVSVHRPLHARGAYLQDLDYEDLSTHSDYACASSQRGLPPENTWTIDPLENRLEFPHGQRRRFRQRPTLAFLRSSSEN